MAGDPKPPQKESGGLFSGVIFKTVTDTAQMALGLGLSALTLGEMGDLNFGGD